MIEHAPWVGSNYKHGLDGQNLAIVGWSHYGDEGEDFGTIKCINEVISGSWKIRFFTQIRNYFGYSDHGIFWQRVVFFNYLPTLVGGAKKKFGNGTQEQQHIAKERFKRLIGDTLPKKVLVFTSRRWAFPPMENPERLDPHFPQFLKCGYIVGGHKTTAFFLRHPQGANGNEMRRAVQYVLEIPTG